MKIYCQSGSGNHLAAMLGLEESFRKNGEKSPFLLAILLPVKETMRYIMKKLVMERARLYWDS
jgi:hypothetical protein